MEAGARIFQFLLFFFNFLFFICGVGLISIGSYIYGYYGKNITFGEKEFLEAELFIIIVGIVLFVIGFVGCWGAVKTNKCLIGTFASLLIIMFILQVAAAALIQKNNASLSEAGSRSLDIAVNNYYNHHAAKKMMDWAQAKFSCCGNNGPGDYDLMVKNSTCYPEISVASCHIRSNCSLELYEEGCHDMFVKFLGENFETIAVVAIAVAFLEIAGIFFALCLVMNAQDEYEILMNYF